MPSTLYPTVYAQKSLNLGGKRLRNNVPWASRGSKLNNNPADRHTRQHSLTKDGSMGGQEE